MCKACQRRKDWRRYEDICSCVVEVHVLRSEMLTHPADWMPKEIERNLEVLRRYEKEGHDIPSFAVANEILWSAEP